MAILATERVPTLDYWKFAGKLQRGDYVFDREGNVVQIKLAQQYLAPNCYEVTFSDYLTISGDKALTLPTENLKYRTRTYAYKNVLKFTRPLKPYNIDELLETPLIDKYDRMALSVPTTKPIQFPHQDLPVPPFVFGFWFFARRSTKAMAPPPGCDDVVHQEFKDSGYKVTERWHLRNGATTFSAIPTVESHLVPSIPTTIPNNYLFGSVEQRIALLRGIMMSKTRRYNEKSDTFRFSTKQYKIAKQVQGLVESLGCKTSMAKHKSEGHYTVTFRTKHKLLPNQRNSPLKVHQARRYITKISPIQPQSCIHIETTGPDNTILVGEGFISCL